MRVFVALALVVATTAGIVAVAQEVQAGGCTECGGDNRVPVEYGPEINTLYKHVEGTCDMPDGDSRLAKPRRLYARDSNRLLRLMGSGGSQLNGMASFDSQRIIQCHEGEHAG